MARLFAKSRDPDQTAASYLDLHGLPITLLEVPRLIWVKIQYFYFHFILLRNTCFIKSMSLRVPSLKTRYGKCPKISNTKVSDKMTCANSANPDQTTPEGVV